MKKICVIITAILAITVLLMGTYGCKKEGPGERAGKKIDETVEKGGNQLEKAGKKIDETVEKGGEQLEKAGKKIQGDDKGK